MGGNSGAEHTSKTILAGHLTAWGRGLHSTGHFVVLSEVPQILAHCEGSLLLYFNVVTSVTHPPRGFSHQLRVAAAPQAGTVPQPGFKMPPTTSAVCLSFWKSLQMVIYGNAQDSQEQREGTSLFQATAFFP